MSDPNLSHETDSSSEQPSDSNSTSYMTPHTERHAGDTTSTTIVVSGNSAITSNGVTSEGKHNEEVIQRRMREGMTVGSPSPHQHFVRRTQTDADPSQHSPTDNGGFEEKSIDKTVVAQCTEDSSLGLNIVKLIKDNPQKKMIAFLCVCTGDPDKENYIENCTAMEKMRDCFKTKLGYLTIPVGENVTTTQLDDLINQIKVLGTNLIPNHFTRVLFYFFGHGTEDSIQLADGFYPRDVIIKNFQSICPQDTADHDIYKIFIFDCCRVVNGATTEAVQQSEEQRSLEQKSLGGDEPPWTVRSEYPASTNTLVINATDCNCMAYYKVTNGCGLMTYFFSQLAPKRNESLSDLLVAVRREIIKHSSGQMLVYEDKLMGTCNLLAESCGTARVVPKGLDITPGPSISTANIHFTFDDNVKDRISEFEIISTATSDSSSLIVQGVPSSDRKAVLAGLTPGTTYSTKVIAKYDDGESFDSEFKEFTVPDLKGAEISSKCLTRLSPLKLQVKWQMESQSHSEVYYEVHLNNNRVVSECHDTNAEIEVEPGTTYSLKIVTCFTIIDGRQYSRESEVESYESPPHDYLQPKIVCSEVTRNSVKVTVTDPLIFQPLNQTQYSAREFAPSDSFRLTRVPIDNEKFTSHVIRRDPSVNIPEVILHGNIAGKKYKVKCEMDCTSGDILRNDVSFTADKPLCTRRLFSSLYCIIAFYSIIFLLFFAGTIISYTSYSIHYRATEDGETHYIYKESVVQCGAGNSFRYKGINIAGSQDEDDIPEDTFNSWLVPENELKLYTKTVGPIKDGYPLISGVRYRRPLGWEEYLWKGTVISGFCCVKNLNIINGSDYTTSLFLFPNIDDADRLITEKIAENYVILETLSIPAGTERCFTKWGPNQNFTTTVNGFHNFVVYFSADDWEFDSSITYEERFVNTSDYQNPRSVPYLGHTYYEYPSTSTDYLVICNLPMKLGSLHTRSWGSPRWNTKFTVISSIGLVIFILSLPCLIYAIIYTRYSKSMHL